MSDRRAVTTPPGSLLDALRLVALWVGLIYCFGVLALGVLLALTAPIWVWWVA